MKKKGILILVALIVVGGLAALFMVIKPMQNSALEEYTEEEGYAGSRSCIECHERFYQLWSPSHHGKAMQPTGDVINNNELHVTSEDIQVGNKWYQAIIEDEKLIMHEKPEKGSDQILKTFVSEWALGGKNIYYFLTPFEGGRLQTMPLAFDLNREEWYSNPQSAVRHFAESETFDEDQEIDWTHSLYTFNTTCHGCHVSQLQKNFDAESNTYHTTWKEPGINCETCHGPSKEHVIVCREAAEKGIELEKTDEALKIIMTSHFTKDMHNSSCAPCHAKMVPLTVSYPPGETFFQHYGLVTLEDPDYYPDGRDLGENYTYTSWSQSPCLKDDNMHCIHCHTSSGRYRFQGETANNACMPCHANNVNNFEQHTRHKNDGKVECISCHMPMTEFARMRRSDHSMRPPMPAASIEFGSPNSCTICHEDETNEWANKQVTEWHGDYQNETLRIGKLIRDGRNNDYKKLDDMLELINDQSVDFVFRTSMIRILNNHHSEKKTEPLLIAMNDAHPQIRAAAAEALQFSYEETTKKALLNAATDSFRVVRIAASVAIARMPQQMFTPEEMQIVQANYSEYEDYLMTQPDSWSSHYNLGNFYHGRGMFQQAAQSFEKAQELETEIISPSVNASMSYSMMGDLKSAEQKLKDALTKEPDNAVANFNYGLLLGQLNRMDEAKSALRKALENDSTMSAAAYNLAVISAATSVNEALKYSEIAAELSPENGRYGYTYAYYLKLGGKYDEAIKVTEKIIKDIPDYADAYMFLGSIYEEQKQIDKAISVYEKCLKVQVFPEQFKQNVQARIQYLKQSAI